MKEIEDSDEKWRVFGDWNGGGMKVK